MRGARLPRRWMQASIRGFSRVNGWTRRAYSGGGVAPVAVAVAMGTAVGWTQFAHGKDDRDTRGVERLHAEMEREQNMEDFTKMMRFGMVDMSILMMSLVAGVSLDGVIARFIGVQGYGAIVGAGLGNCVADVIAGLPDGLYSSLGVGVGTLLPLLPLAIPMVLKRPFTATISHAFGATSLGFCALAFVWGWRHHHDEEESSTETVGQVATLVNAKRYDEAILMIEQLKSSNNTSQ